MEKTTKHRVLGIFIIVAAVFLLLPFIQTKEDTQDLTINSVLPNTVEQQEEGVAIENKNVTNNTNPAQTLETPDTHNNVTEKNEEKNANEVEQILPSKAPEQLRNKKTLTPIKKLAQTKITPPQHLFAIKNNAWVIEAQSFNKKSQALTLTRRLKQQSYPAFYQRVTSNKGIKYIVFVGPNHQFKDAVLLADNIKKQYHLNTIVVKYGMV